MASGWGFLGEFWHLNCDLMGLVPPVKVKAPRSYVESEDYLAFDFYENERQQVLDPERAEQEQRHQQFQLMGGGGCGWGYGSIELPSVEVFYQQASPPKQRQQLISGIACGFEFCDFVLDFHQRDDFLLAMEEAEEQQQMIKAMKRGKQQQLIGCHELPPVEVFYEQQEHVVEVSVSVSLPSVEVFYEQPQQQKKQRLDTEGFGFHEENRKVVDEIQSMLQKKKKGGKKQQRREHERLESSGDYDADESYNIVNLKWLRNMERDRKINKKRTTFSRKSNK